MRKQRPMVGKVILQQLYNTRYRIRIRTFKFPDFTFLPLWIWLEFFLICYVLFELKLKIFSRIDLTEQRLHYADKISVQFSSVAQSCPTLCDPMNCSTPGLLVHHQLQEFTQTHFHRVSDTIQPSHPLSSPSPPAPNPYPSQHQSLFQWVNSLHRVAKVLEFQL